MSPGITDSAERLGVGLMQSLPGQFLALVVLNLAFIGSLMWFLAGVDARRTAFEQAAVDARERLLTPLLTACVNDQFQGGNHADERSR